MGGSKLLCLSFILLSFEIAHSQQSKSDDVVGTWLTADKTGEITIFKDSGKYFGEITGGSSEQQFDIHNPDEKRRRDPLLGMVIIRNLVFDEGSGTWDDGIVYDPQNGKRYSCTLRLVDRNTLKVTGYVGFSWIGRSEEWTRID